MPSDAALRRIALVGGLVMTAAGTWFLVRYIHRTPPAVDTVKFWTQCAAIVFIASAIGLRAHQTRLRVKQPSEASK